MRDAHPARRPARRRRASRPTRMGARLPRTAARARGCGARSTRSCGAGSSAAARELNETRRRLGLPPLDRVHGGISPRAVRSSRRSRSSSTRARWRAVGARRRARCCGSRRSATSSCRPATRRWCSSRRRRPRTPSSGCCARRSRGWRAMPVRVLATDEPPPAGRRRSPCPRTRGWSSGCPTRGRCRAATSSSATAATARWCARWRRAASVVACPAAGDMNENAARVDWAGVGRPPAAAASRRRAAVRLAVRARAGGPAAARARARARRLGGGARRRRAGGGAGRATSLSARRAGARRRAGGADVAGGVAHDRVAAHRHLARRGAGAAARCFEIRVVIDARSCRRRSRRSRCRACARGATSGPSSGGWRFEKVVSVPRHRSSVAGQPIAPRSCRARSAAWRAVGCGLVVSVSEEPVVVVPAPLPVVMPAEVEAEAAAARPRRRRRSSRSRSGRCRSLAAPVASLRASGRSSRCPRGSSRRRSGPRPSSRNRCGRSSACRSRACSPGRRARCRRRSRSGR